MHRTHLACLKSISINGFFNVLSILNPKAGRFLIFRDNVRQRAKLAGRRERRRNPSVLTRCRPARAVYCVLTRIKPVGEGLNTDSGMLPVFTVPSPGMLVQTSQFPRTRFVR